MAAVDGALPWRRCDPGDGSAAYFFNTETGATSWEAPDGIEASTIPDFGFEDEEVLDTLGITPLEQDDAGTAAPADARAAEPGGDDGASDSTADTTTSPPPLPADSPVAGVGGPPAIDGAPTSAAGAAVPGTRPGPAVDGGPAAGDAAAASAASRAEADAPPASTGAQDDAPPPAAEEEGPPTGQAAPPPARPKKARAPPRPPASLPRWGLPEPTPGAEDFHSAARVAAVAAVLGVWSRSAGTHGSIVGTLGHPIRGGRVSAVGQWVTRRGESRGIGRGEVYWVNRVTGETRWSRPTDTDGSDLSDSALEHADVSDADPLLGARPAASDREVLGDPDARIEEVWGGDSAAGAAGGGAASLLMMAGLLPEALAAAWGAAETEAGDEAAAAADVGDDFGDDHGDDGSAPRCSAPSARALSCPPPWVTLPTVPTAVPASPGDGGPSAERPASWRLAPVLPSLAPAPAHDDDGDDGDGWAGPADHDPTADDDVIGSVLRAAAGPALATGLYRRLSALLHLMQSRGSDEEWSRLLHDHHSALPRLLVSCLGPTMPPAVCRAAAQALFLSAQLSDDVGRLLVTPAPPRAAGGGGGAGHYPPCGSAVDVPSTYPLWRGWNGTRDALSACMAGVVAAVHGWRLRWPRSAAPAPAPAPPGAPLPHQVDEESLFSFCLLVDLVLGAAVLDPLGPAELGYASDGTAAAAAAAGPGLADAEPLRDDAWRVALCSAMAEAVRAAPRGATSAAAVAALASASAACEEAALLAAEEAGRDTPPGLPGLGRVLSDDPSLVPVVAAALLDVLVRVADHHSTGSAAATPDQVTAAASLLRRLLHPGSLPPCAASLFFTSDLRVLVDICLRETVDLPESDPQRAEFLFLLKDVLLCTQWHAQGAYRADDVVRVVSDLVTSGAADAVGAVREAAEDLLVECRDLLDD